MKTSSYLSYSLLCFSGVWILLQWILSPKVVSCPFIVYTDKGGCYMYENKTNNVMTNASIQVLSTCMCMFCQNLMLNGSDLHA